MGKIDIKIKALAVERDYCLKSFFEFIQSFWGVIIKEEPGYNWHIEYLCGELQDLAEGIIKREEKKHDIIINIPPGTTKSTITTIMFPAWLWTQDPSIKIITNSYSADLSIEHAVKSRDIIISDKYRMFFPDVVIRRDRFAKTSYENTRTGARYTTSTGGTITGKHAHIIINDDPLNPKQAASEADRKSAIEHVKTLASRKVDKKITPTITIMQRLHENDVTGYLLAGDPTNTKHICLPAYINDNIKPGYLKERYINGLLDPTRLSGRVLEEQKKELGARVFSGQYQQDPAVEGGNIVKKEWFKYVSREEFNRLSNGKAITFFIDTAFTEKEENDPTGIIGACGIDKNVYITCASTKRLEFPELLKFIPIFVKNNGYDERSTIRIEPKANGLSVIQQLKESTGLNVTKTESPKESKLTRLTAKSPVIECGSVFLVTDGWNEEFIEEVCGFPNKNHDEYVDLLCYAIDYFKQSFTVLNENEILSDFL